MGSMLGGLGRRCGVVTRLSLFVAALLLVPMEAAWATFGYEPTDCNGNHLPDICETNPKQQPILCAFYCWYNDCGKAPDCNGNDVPDECDANIAGTAADVCRDANAITPLPSGEFYSGTTRDARPEGSTECGKSGSNGSPSVYYTYTPDSDGELTASLCGSSYDTVLSIHAPSCPTTVESTLACNDDSGVSGCDEQSVITMPVTAGTTYIIRIAGAKPHEEGKFQLTLSGPPSTLGNGDCDGDGILNSCETDSDADGLPDDCDNCPQTENLSQEDSDGDGLGDSCEACPMDPAKVEYGECGCGVADVDSDGDGVADCNDQCELDPSKTAPGMCGCGTPETDGDGDGVPDCLDQCSLDSAKSIPGLCGCGLPDFDSDGDGTLDCQDECPLDNAKTAAGSCGCGVADRDSDGDGIADCSDQCSSDPLKSAPGMCGCGVSDVDSDGDSIPDCNDQCTSDPAKSSPGVCGCGTPDSDTDGDGLLDCTEQCPSDPEKAEPGICGCGLPDADLNKDGIPECICAGSCDLGNAQLDEDGDSRSNCDELAEGTAPCDSGSFIPKLDPISCAGSNGFFGSGDQPTPNVATIVNHLSSPLQVRVEHRDRFGELLGQVDFTLGALLKRDIIINELGLKNNSYGTVCVFTDALVSGAWSGGITIYKGATPEDNSLAADDTFDFALFYPFSNPQTGRSVVPLNTNVLGTDGLGTVANWIRLTDARPGDGKGLRGTLYYYDGEGAPIKEDVFGRKIDGKETVNLPDGGRFDFSGHEKVGFRGIGFAEFVPDPLSDEYYIESSRYFYRGAGASSTSFYTAFTIPNRPPTGAPTTGMVSQAADELSIIEIANASGAPISAALKLFNDAGVEQSGLQSGLFVPSKGSRHLVITEGLLSGSPSGSAEISGPPESISALTLVYKFSADGELAFAYAPSFSESAGVVQLTDFNSFLGNKNLLRIRNSSAKDIEASISAVDYLNVPIPGLSGLTVIVPARGSITVPLALPPDTYGTVIVDAQGEQGLVLRNDVEREGQYVLSFFGR